MDNIVIQLYGTVRYVVVAVVVVLITVVRYKFKPVLLYKKNQQEMLHRAVFMYSSTVRTTYISSVCWTIMQRITMNK